MTKMGRACGAARAGAGSGVSRKFRFASYSSSAAGAAPSRLDMMFSASARASVGPRRAPEVRATHVPKRKEPRSGPERLTVARKEVPRLSCCGAGVSPASRVLREMRRASADAYPMLARRPHHKKTGNQLLGSVSDGRGLREGDVETLGVFGDRLLVGELRPGPSG